MIHIADSKDGFIYNKVRSIEMWYGKAITLCGLQLWDISGKVINEAYWYEQDKLYDSQCCILCKSIQADDKRILDEQSQEV